MPDDPKFRFMVEEARTNRIIVKDMVVQEPQIQRLLSGPCQISFQINPEEPSCRDPQTGKPIQFKPWGHWIHVEKEINGVRKIFASGLVKPSESDPTTGILSLEAEGFSNYPKDIPWLENWNPIAVDPFEIVERIWSHLQSYEHGNLGVQVYPTSSGTQMLPGYSFQSEELVPDFFAIFIRAVDFINSGDYINKLTRDTPFDYFEESSWNANKDQVLKKIRLGYPQGGVDQSNVISFRINENVLQATPKLEVDIQWTSDVIIRGWFPSKVYSAELSNADPLRYRRVVMEEDVSLNSNERNAAWAKRKLARRQVPFYWSDITLDMYHTNAPFGTYDVGDTILVQGQMPWKGKVVQRHRITGMAIDPVAGQCQLSLMAEGAFNYDPIVYPPDV